MPPTLKKLMWHIGCGLSVHPSVHSSRTLHARVLKFHIWKFGHFKPVSKISRKVVELGD